MQRELDSLPQLIEELETKIEELQASINDPSFFQQSPEETTPKLEALAKAESELETAFERWEELEALQKDN